MYIEGRKVVISKIYCIPFAGLNFDFALACSEEPDEMPHNTVFLLGLQCFLSSNG